MMRVLKDIKELLEEELKTIRKKGTITQNELDGIYKMVETIKHIDEICDDYDHDEYDRNYSGRSNRENRYSGTYSVAVHDPNMMPMDYMYSSNGPRSGDRMYSGRHMGHMGRYGTYSREGATSHMIGRLEEMMDQANNEHEREAIRTCIDKLSW